MVAPAAELGDFSATRDRMCPAQESRDASCIIPHDLAHAKVLDLSSM
jgi:hypothetical protein